MTTELVTAHAGTNHVDSEDIGALYAGALGSGRYVLDVGEGMAVSMTDANTIRIGTGGFVFDGRWVRVTEAEEIKVESGTQAAYRKDLVTYTYTRDPSSGNVEAGEWGVVTGTAASKEADAKVPTVEAASILDRDLKVVCPVAEVDIAGLTPTAKLLLPSVKSLKALGESVSRNWVRLDNSLTCYVEGGTCVVSTDFLALPASKTHVKVGALPGGLRPVGAASVEVTGSDGASYIAPLAYRGGDGTRFGQIYVSRGGNIYAYVTVGGAANAYYYGQLVFPVA